MPKSRQFEGSLKNDNLSMWRLDRKKLQGIVQEPKAVSPRPSGNRKQEVYKDGSLKRSSDLQAMPQLWKVTERITPTLPPTSCQGSLLARGKASPIIGPHRVKEDE